MYYDKITAKFCGKLLNICEEIRGFCDRCVNCERIKLPTYKKVCVVIPAQQTGKRYFAPISDDAL